MRGTDWQEVNRKITEFYNAIKECEFFFVRSGEETEYAEISKYGRLEKGYDTGQEWIETDWFIEFQIYMDKDFIIKHMMKKFFLTIRKKVKYWRSLLVIFRFILMKMIISVTAGFATTLECRERYRLTQ